MEGWSRKVYLELPVPSEEDHRPLQERLFAALEDSGPFRLERAAYIRMRPKSLQEAQGICEAGGWRVKVEEDGWTAVTLDKKPAAHYENTIVIRESGVEILTL